MADEPAPEADEASGSSDEEATGNEPAEQPLVEVSVRLVDSSLQSSPLDAAESSDEEPNAIEAQFVVPLLSREFRDVRALSPPARTMADVRVAVRRSFRGGQPLAETDTGAGGAGATTTTTTTTTVDR